MAGLARATGSVRVRNVSSVSAKGLGMVVNAAQTSTATRISIARLHSTGLGRVSASSCVRLEIAATRILIVCQRISAGMLPFKKKKLALRHALSSTHERSARSLVGQWTAQVRLNSIRLRMERFATQASRFK